LYKLLFYLCLYNIAYQIKTLKNQAEIKNLLKTILQKLSGSPVGPRAPIPASTHSELIHLQDWATKDGSYNILVGFLRLIYNVYYEPHSYISFLGFTAVRISVPKCRENMQSTA
jgi:hypothetical protein